MLFAVLIPLIFALTILYHSFSVIKSSKYNIKLPTLKNSLLVIPTLLLMFFITYIFSKFFVVKISFNITHVYLFVVLTIFVAINEELFFRVLPNHLYKTKPLILKLLVSTLMFALAHFGYGIYGVLQAFFLGLVLYLFYNYTKNYLLNIILHFLYNMITYFLNNSI